MKLLTNNRLVVTGMGVITPLGNTLETFWRNLISGKCGIDTLTRFDTTDLPVKIGAEVKDFNPTDYMTKKQTREMDLFMQYGYAAASMALEDGKNTAAPERTGLVIGTALGGIAEISTTQDGLSTGCLLYTSTPFPFPSGVASSRPLTSLRPFWHSYTMPLFLQRCQQVFLYR